MTGLGDTAKRSVELRKKISELRVHLLKHKKMLPGSMYTAKTRCGRKSCRCMDSNYRHENICLSFSDQGQSRTRTVPADLTKTVAALTQAHRKARKLHREIAALSKSLLLRLDRTIREAAERGRVRVIPALHSGRRPPHA
jgi:hypothetical protein